MVKPRMRYTAEETSVRHLKGVIEAYLKGKPNCSLNWICGQITKGHSIHRAKLVIGEHGASFKRINEERFYKMLEELGMEAS